MILFTIGYDALSPRPLVEELEAVGVRRVVDVRFRAQSARPRRYRTRLGTSLTEQGIAYKNPRGLGIPPHIHRLRQSGRVAEARATYAVWMTGSFAMDALARELPDAPPTVLLGVEADAADCHRSVIAAELRARLPGLEVVDL